MDIYIYIIYIYVKYNYKCIQYTHYVYIYMLIFRFRECNTIQARVFRVKHVFLRCFLSSVQDKDI